MWHHLCRDFSTERKTRFKYQKSKYFHRKCDVCGGDCPIKDLASRPFTHRTASGERGWWCLHVYSCLPCPTAFIVSLHLTAVTYQPYLESIWIRYLLRMGDNKSPLRKFVTEGARTLDPKVRRLAFYQLSYVVLYNFKVEVQCKHQL